MRFLERILGDLVPCSVRLSLTQNIHTKLIPSGTFTSLYKFLINALPMLIPSVSPTNLSDPFDDEDGIEAELPTSIYNGNRRKTRLSLSTRTKLILVRKKTRRWHAALAGAIAGGLAIICEKRNRRGLIAQQMFVR